MKFHNQILQSSSLFQNYSNALDWLTSKVVMDKSCRLYQYLKDLESISNISNSQMLATTLKNPQNKHLRAAFYEAHGLIEIWMAFNESVPIPNHILKELGKGYGIYSDAPTDKADTSRNFFNELIIGKELINSGLPLHLPLTSDASDAETDHNSYKIFIECKRPLSQNTVPANIKKGFDQLKRRFTEKNKYEAGFVFINITKAENPDFNIIDAPNLKFAHKSSEKLMINECNKIARMMLSSQGIFRNSLRPEILGFVFYYDFLNYFTESKTIGLQNLTFFGGIQRNANQFYHLFKELDHIFQKQAQRKRIK